MKCIEKIKYVNQKQLLYLNKKTKLCSKIFSNTDFKNYDPGDALVYTELKKKDCDVSLFPNRFPCKDAYIKFDIGQFIYVIKTISQVS